MPAADGTPIVLVGGKGGVGKTTVAAALAAASAAAGMRTLLVSTDPAHSTADLVGVVPGAEPVPVASPTDERGGGDGDGGRDGAPWYVLEIDADQAARDHVDRIAAQAADVVPAAVLPAVRRHLDAALASPGTQESALLDRLGDVLLAAEDDGWDRVVVDTAPTGHTLRLLALPELMSGWVEGLLTQRERFLRTEALARGLAREQSPDAPDPVAARLRERRDVLAAVRDLLRERAVVHLVTVPERLPVLETVRAAAALREAGLRLGAVVVNRVFPAGDDPFLQARGRRQAHWLEQVATDLPDLPRVVLPHLAEDVALADLPGLSAELRAAGL